MHESRKVSTILTILLTLSLLTNVVLLVTRPTPVSVPPKQSAIPPSLGGEDEILHSRVAFT